MRRAALLFACLSLPFSLLYADHIYVNGNVSGTWSADTVFVTGEIRVPVGETLVIEPGVKVLFQAYVKFIVDSNATLVARGTVMDSIRFDESIPGNRWKGIRFLSASSSSNLTYCHVTHGSASGSGEDAQGGAIYCNNANPTIENCLIDNCSATGNGGGVYCGNNSHPSLSGNIISGNSASYGGGTNCEDSDPSIIGNLISENGAIGIHCHSSSPNLSGNIIIGNGARGISCDNSSPIIIGNLICDNSPSSGAGIRCVNNSSPTLRGNIVSGNSASSAIMSVFGGGIYCADSSPMLIENIIRGNEVQGDEMGGYGGGIYCTGSNPIIALNEISHNLAAATDGWGYGGGVCFSGGSTWFYKNTVAYNSVSPGWAGGLYSSGSVLDVANCVFWGNSSSQISGEGSVTYSNLQGGWPGTGNLNLYPSFVDTRLDDYRLNWGSPCIDSGDPNPQYNDPDGTRADMGAFFFDQSTPVRVLLSPHEIPYLIPENGGSLDYTIRADNWDSLAHTTTIWCDVTLPDSSIYGPVLGPVTVTVAAWQTLIRIRTQNVPASAPLGVYHYNAYAVVGSDTSKDSFLWGKLGTTNDGPRDWSNFGEDFNTTTAMTRDPHNSSFIIHNLKVSPNPFNPTTVISFELRAASYVQLEVFDIKGQRVGTGLAPVRGNGGGRTPALQERWYPAGSHEITFDGVNLPSGVYFARLTAGEQTAVQKLVLLK